MLPLCYCYVISVFIWLLGMFFFMSFAFFFSGKGVYSVIHQPYYTLQCMHPVSHKAHISTIWKYIYIYINFVFYVF